MKLRHLLLALAIGAGLVTLAACKKDEPATDSAATPAAPATGSGHDEDIEVTGDGASFPPTATMCHKCSTKALVLMDGCATCLNCGYSKCG